MKPVCLALSLFFSIALLLPAISQAATFTYDLGVVFPGDPTPAGTGPWLQAKFEDVSSGEVKLTLKATGLTSPNFVDASGQGNAELGWLFNINPAFISGLNIVFQSGSNTAPVIATPTEDGYGADGDGLYDFGFSFPAGDRFQQGFTDTFSITSGIVGFDASDFNFLSTHQGGEGDYITAAHIQGIPIPGADQTTSTWVGNGGGNGNVPEPATMLLLGSGLLGLAGYGRKKFFKK